MARYFVRIEDGEPILDPLPVECENDDEAKAYAERVAQDLERGRSTGSQWRVIISTEDGEQIASIATRWRASD
jgi:hypothetical protein